MQESSIQNWEEIYRHNNHLSIWPWTDLVSLVNRYNACSPGSKVLELGCGVGANIPFFLQQDRVQYWAVEGSSRAVDLIMAKYPELAENIYCQDFSDFLSDESNFDLIFDRASVTHNSSMAIKRTMENVAVSLKAGGYFIGVDWFSTEFDEFSSGHQGPDSYTRVDFTSGKLSGTGLAHFTDEDHLRDLLGDLDIIHLDHKIVDTFHSEGSSRFAAWNFVAQKTAGA